MSRIWFLLVIFITTYGNSYELTFNSGLRSYPLAASIDAQYKLETIIWDHRPISILGQTSSQYSNSRWKFGMVQAKALVASHGLVEGAVSVYPVGFLELGTSLSTTSRYYETSPFNCDLIVCKGILRRKNYFARWLLGFDLPQGSVFMILSGHQSLNTISDSSSDFADETERLLGKAGEDEIKSESVLVGFKNDLGAFGLIFRQAGYQKSEQKNQISYLIYRNAIDQYRLSMGLGSYQSSQFQSEISAFVSVSLSQGQTLALF
jgi:hypothetical protein